MESAVRDGGRAPPGGTTGDGDPSGDREPRHPTARMLAPPPVAARQASGPAFAARLAGIDPSVDGLRAHAHGIVAGEQDAQPAADGRRRPAAAQSLRHPRPQPVRRQAMRLARFGAPPGGLAPGRPGDVITAHPRPGLEPPGPIGTVGFALVGRAPPVAVEITAAGMRESHVHDVQITKEAPNYHQQ